MKLSLVAIGSLASAGLFLACSDDDGVSRPGFENPPDGGPVVNLPEAGTYDASGDSAAPRDPFDPADEPIVCAPTSTPGACAVQLVAGRNHFCARMSDGTVKCWGDDEYGALGAKPPKDGPTPIVRTVNNVTTATQISASDATTCVLLADGSVSCWGRNSHGTLGLDAVTPSFDENEHPDATPAAITGVATRVDVGPHNACAVLTDGKVICWGVNEHNQLARPNDPLGWVKVPGEAELAPFAIGRVSIGEGTLLGLTKTGEVVSWGAIFGNRGMLGGRLSSISPDPTANALAQLSGVTSLVATDTLLAGEGGPPIGGNTIGPFPPGPPKLYAHACVIAGGEVRCWGKSDVGALCTGLPDHELLPAPAPVTGKAWPQRLAVGDEITCARMTDGSIQCCGGDVRGRLGTGQTAPFAPLFQPVQSFTGHAVDVATSNRAVCALVQGGSVVCWGSNSRGELGLAAPDDEPHPMPVPIAFQ